MDFDGVFSVLWTVNSGGELSDFDKFCDASRGDPFGDEQITIGCEAGVVWVDELSVFPLIGLTAKIFDFIESFDGASESGDNFILFIEQCDTGFEFRHEHQVALSFDICGQSEACDGFEVFAIHREDLQCVVGSICNDDGGFFACAIIDPQSVCGVEGTSSFPGTSE